MNVVNIILCLLFCYVTKVFGDCGQAATHPDLISYGSGGGKEGQEISFECNDNLDKFKNGDFKMAYWSSRKCVNGKWNRRIPKCAYLIPAKFTIDYINYPDTKLNETFKNWREVEFKQTKHMKVQVHFEPASRVSFIVFSFGLDVSSDNFKVDIFLNKYRECFENPLYLEKGYQKYTTGEFICEAKSFEHYNEETNDLPSTFIVDITSDKLFKIKLNEIKVFQFMKECGRPDLPMHARDTHYGDVVDIDPYPNHLKYKQIENGTYQVKCLYEGNWDKQFSEFEPIIQCLTHEFDFNSTYYKSIRSMNFGYFNGSEVAVIDSFIEFQCNDSIDVNTTYTAICDKNESWRILGKRCEQNDQDTSKQSGLKESNSTNMVIIILAALLLTTILIIIFVGIYMWRRSSKKKVMKEKEKYLDEKYDDIDNNNYEEIEAKNVYEDIHYEVVGTESNEYTKVYEGINNSNENDNYVQIAK